MHVHNRFSGIWNKIVKSKTGNGSESSHGLLFKQEDSKQAQKYLHRKYGHPDP